MLRFHLLTIRARIITISKITLKVKELQRRIRRKKNIFGSVSSLFFMTLLFVFQRKKCLHPAKLLPYSRWY